MAFRQPQLWAARSLVHVVHRNRAAVMAGMVQSRQYFASGFHSSASSFSSSTSNDTTESPNTKVVYEGPFSQTAKRLKLFSVSSLMATIALCPFIFILDAGISNGMRGGLAVAAVATSGSSTALVQWCLGSYARTISLPKPQPSSSGSLNSESITRSTPVSFETLSFWGGQRITTVKVADLEPSSAPFSTVRIRDGHEAVVRDGKGKILAQGNKIRKRFYLHNELLEEEPLRSVMAEIQQNQMAGARPGSMASSNSTSTTSAPTETTTNAGSGGMSDRIEELKRQAAKKSQ